MKAVICSTDGIPVEVAVVNEDDQAERLQKDLRDSGCFDRVDIRAVTAAQELADYAASEQAARVQA